MGLIHWAKNTERKVEMDFIEKLIAGFIERSCKNYVTTIIGVISIIVFGVNQFGNLIPAQYHDYVNLALSVLTGVSLILSKDSGVPVVKAAIVLALLLTPFSAAAQSTTGLVPAPEKSVQNFYAGGASYSVGAKPAVAGTALYAHAIANTDGSYPTYAFTAIDATPNTLSPFTINTNVGVGIAQKITSLGKVGIFMPTAAGISWSGSNTGWQWNGGVLAAIPIKNGYYIAPTVRFLKSSVSGGTGYQPIIGVLFGWGR